MTTPLPQLPSRRPARVFLRVTAASTAAAGLMGLAANGLNPRLGGDAASGAAWSWAILTAWVGGLAANLIPALTAQHGARPLAFGLLAGLGARLLGTLGLGLLVRMAAPGGFAGDTFLIALAVAQFVLLIVDAAGWIRITRTFEAATPHAELP